MQIDLSLLVIMKKYSDEKNLIKWSQGNFVVIVQIQRQ